MRLLVWRVVKFCLTFLILLTINFPLTSTRRQTRICCAHCLYSQNCQSRQPHEKQIQLTMVCVQVSYNGADSFRKVQTGPKPWLEIIKNFKDTEHSGNASSPFYKLLFFSIWPCPCQLDENHHELNPILAIFRTQNKQGRFIQLNLYRCMYFCQTKLLKLLTIFRTRNKQGRFIQLNLYRCMYFCQTKLLKLLTTGADPGFF